MVTDMKLTCSLPMTILNDNGEATCQTICNIYYSRIITDVIHRRLRTTKVSGIPDIFFGDIVNIILNRGMGRVFINGGFLRDIFMGKDADDMDILVAQDKQSSSIGIIAYLESVCKNKGWAVSRKVDERTKNSRWDFLCIGDKEEKDGFQKFTCHPIGVGCEGEFTCNTLMYNVMTGALIDPTGQGW